MKINNYYTVILAGLTAVSTSLIFWFKKIDKQNKNLEMDRNVLRRDEEIESFAISLKNSEKICFFLKNENEDWRDYDCNENLSTSKESIEFAKIKNTSSYSNLIIAIWFNKKLISLVLYPENFFYILIEGRNTLIKQKKIKIKYFSNEKYSRSESYEL